MSESSTQHKTAASVPVSPQGLATSSAVAVSVRGASKTFPGGLRALEPIDIDVREGDFATLLGPSGCGKSTLLRMIGGLTIPTMGQVSVRSAPSTSAGPSGLNLPTHHPSSDIGPVRSGLAFVFQSPTLMPWANIARNVQLPLELARHSADQASKVNAALRLVGLDDFAAAYPRQLSGGMQMRASIARALVTEPRLLLMDEPFGALDEITRNRLDREILDLWARRSLTVVFVTHSIYEAVYLSNRVLVMSARPGRIVADVGITEPHPRSDAFRVSERYARWCKELSDLLAAGSEAAASRE